MNTFMILYRYELKKLFMRKIVWTFFAICLVATGITMVAGLMGSFYIGNEAVDTNYNMFLKDRAYQSALDGRKINQSLLEEMSSAYGMIPLTADRYNTTEEYQKYARPYSEIFNFVRSATDMTASEAIQWSPNEKDLYAKRQDMLERTWQSENLSDGEKEFWRQSETELKRPFVYQIKESYVMLFKAISTIGVCMLLSVAVCLAGVFADEHAKRTDQLILCSTHGKGIAYWAKILAGISYAVGISLILSAVAFGLAFSVYGTDGFTAMFQLMFADYSYPLTAGEATLILYGCMSVTTVIFSVFVMLLSEMLHSSIATLAVTSGTLILCMFYSIPPQYRALAQIWDWLPGVFFTPQKVFDVRLFPAFGHYFTAWQAVPIIYLIISATIAVSGEKIYRRYRIPDR